MVMVARLEKGGGFLVDEEDKFVYRACLDEIASLIREMQSESPREKSRDGRKAEWRSESQSMMGLRMRAPVELQASSPPT